jgi:hypothetical protein
MSKPFRRYEMLLPLRFNDGDQLKARFQQVEIWMTTYPLQVM